MPDWTHAVAAGIGTLPGVFFGFLLKWRKTTTDEWQAIINRLGEIVRKQGERIAVLEARTEELHKENAETRKENITCLQTQAALQAEIAELTRNRRRRPPHKDDTDEHNPLGAA